MKIPGRLAPIFSKGRISVHSCVDAGIFAIYSPILPYVWDPFVATPKPNRTLIYLGACIIAGLRLARERQVNVHVVPTGNAIEESIDLSHEIFNRVFRRVPEKMDQNGSS